MTEMDDWMIPATRSQKSEERRIVDAEARKPEVQGDVVGGRSGNEKSGPTAGKKRAKPTAGKNTRCIVGQDDRTADDESDEELHIS